MIVYSNNKKQFMDDVKSNSIHTKILNEVKRKKIRGGSESEIASWRNSMQFMSSVIDTDDIPNNAGVAIEYTIPLTGKRIDFILTGQNTNQQDTAVIIELKQWSKVEKTSKDAIVKTFVGGKNQEKEHPSYQAWTYSALIEDYNETIRGESIQLTPCAYLHNMDSRAVINDPFYNEYTNKAPVFISKDALKLAQFLEAHVKYGDTNDIMYRIDNGKIKPSKNLADCLASMLKGNAEFLMIDDQKLVYETAIDLTHQSSPENKQILIVEGGPGTGKSVVAINLLVALTKREFVTQYISKNAAPRAVYEAKLKGSMKKSQISNLFRGSGSFTETPVNSFNTLIVDEAHRLNKKSGLFSNMGENQVKELINASCCTVFFLDEAQRVHWQDIGSKAEIHQWATQLGATVHELKLQSQFRCNGSDGYLAWIDNTLQIRDTANPLLDNNDYDFRVFDNPNELREAIIAKNRTNNKSRMVAGYCWDWDSKKTPDAMDIIISEYGFEAQWNLGKDGSLWIMAEKSVHQIGCIHTCQGLELDYVGVILGNDFIIRNGEVITDGNQRSKMDASIKGYKKALKENSESAKQQADEIIKNTYRTLMTRGQKGCYIFSVDPETNEYFKSVIEQEQQIEAEQEKYAGLNLPILTTEEAQNTPNTVPIFNLQAAAGSFSDYQTAGEHDWVELPGHLVAKEGFFVIQVVGDSMNKRIPNGAWCLFKANPTGTRQGKIVLVESRDIQDAEYGGHYTVKTYHSEKVETDEGWQHSKIILRPDSYNFVYEDIVLDEKQVGSLSVIGELIAVLT